MRPAKDLRKWLMLATVGVSALIGYAPRAEADPFIQTDLVSNIPGLADITDPLLINPWGVSESPTSPFWISDQGANDSTLYTVSGGSVTQRPLVVAIPTTAAGPQGPTGQVNNPTSAFAVGAAPANFIFANLNGTISAWNPGAGTAAQVVATTPGAVYTGLAIDAASTRLYAANSAAGRIDVFNGSFAPTTVTGSFTDPNLPTGFVPFNVQNIDGKIYVTYSPPGRTNQIAATAGMGVVDVYDTNGNLLQRLISASALASPWGLALAPSGFGPFGGDLLVGNFSFADSGINVFDPTTGALLGSIPIDVGAGNTPGGLWNLIFGNGAAGGDLNTLYFTDGINGESAGLFAAISPVPEPSALWLLAPALGLIAACRRRPARG